MKLQFSILSVFVIIGALFAFAACTDIENAQANSPVIKVDKLTLSPSSMSLFTDGGERTMTALLPEEIANKVVIDWEVANTDIAEIAVVNDKITVFPKTDGKTVITARIRPISETLSLEGQSTEVNATITVLEGFVLNNSWFLVFMGEGSQEVTAVIPEDVLQVARVAWSVNTENSQSILLTGEGKTVKVDPQGLEPSGIITAKLEADDPAAFNGNGRLAVCVVTVLEAPHITLNPVSLRLGPEGDKTVLITAEYGPGRVDMFEPSVKWTSSNTSILEVVENGSASLGYATTYITAKALNAGASMATVTATLKVEDREVAAILPVPVDAFDTPIVAITSVTLTGTPSAPVIKSDTTGLITASVTSSTVPTDSYVEWSFSETGVVELIESDDAVNNNKKYVRGVWRGDEPQEVTVTASSRSNPDKTASFAITVQPIAVTISSVARTSTPTAGEQPFVAALQADVNTVGNRNILDWMFDHHELVVLTSSGERNQNAEIVMRSGAVVQDSVNVTVTALAAADNGVSSNTFTVTLNPHSFSVTYNKNDVENSTTTSSSGPHVYASAETLKTIETLGWTVDGMVFDGWSKTADGAVAYANGAAVSALNGNTDAKTTNGTVTLYAKWSPAPPALLD